MKLYINVLVCVFECSDYFRLQNLSLKSESPFLRLNIISFMNAFHVTVHSLICGHLGIFQVSYSFIGSTYKGATETIIWFV